MEEKNGHVIVEEFFLSQFRLRLHAIFKWWMSSLIISLTLDLFQSGLLCLKSIQASKCFCTRTNMNGH